MGWTPIGPGLRTGAGFRLDSSVGLKVLLELVAQGLAHHQVAF